MIDGMNVLVTGANGQLGSEIEALVRHASPTTQNSTFFFTDKDALDITDKDAVGSFCRDNAIDVIINCAAYTAVDRAEEEAAAADRINHLAVRHLAEIAKAQNIRLFHISTDYVFDGKNHRPYVETDPVNPQSVYGRTKLDGEKAIRRVAPPGAVIVRTSWVYSTYGNNFVKTMLRLGKERDELGVIFDQIGSPTYAHDLAKALLQIIQHSTFNTQHAVMIYHYSNEGVVSWYDFAKAVFELSKIDCRVRPIETEEYPTPAKRPHYSLLNKSKIKKEYNIDIPYWKNSLENMLKRLEVDRDG